MPPHPVLLPPAGRPVAVAVPGLGLTAASYGGLRRRARRRRPHGGRRPAGDGAPRGPRRGAGPGVVGRRARAAPGRARPHRRAAGHDRALGELPGRGRARPASPAHGGRPRARRPDRRSTHVAPAPPGRALAAHRGARGPAPRAGHAALLRGDPAVRLRPCAACRPSPRPAGHPRGDDGAGAARGRTRTTTWPRPAGSTPSRRPGRGSRSSP